MGAGPDDGVAILAPNIPEAYMAPWGAQVASRVCPINSLLQTEHIAALLAAAGARLIVALGRNAEQTLWPTVEKALVHHKLPVVQIWVRSVPWRDGAEQWESADC